MSNNLKPIHYAEITREDYTTISVQLSSRVEEVYTYKVTYADLEAWKLKSGMPVVVPVGERKKEESGLDSFMPNYRVGVITEVHKDPRIDYDSTVIYKWVIGPVNTESYFKNNERDAMISDKIKEHQRNVNRQAIRNALLGSDPELMALTGSPQAVVGREGQKYTLAPGFTVEAQAVKESIRNLETGLHLPKDGYDR